MFSGGQVDGTSDAGRKLPGIYIKHVKPNSPAGSSRLLNDGDRILEVCNCVQLGSYNCRFLPVPCYCVSGLCHRMVSVCLSCVTLMDCDHTVGAYS